jgi:ankyrin repeat protein
VWAALSAALALSLSACDVHSPNGEALHRAVLRGDTAEVQRIVEHDPSSVRATDSEGMTALHFTVARLRVSHDAVTVSLSPPTEPSAPGKADERGSADHSSLGCGAIPSWTSYDVDDLKRSIATGVYTRLDAPVTTMDYAPMAELLVSHGAPVNAKAWRRGGVTPLHLAATMGHMSVAKTLLAHGADIRATDLLGLTALHMVAQSGNVALARLLLASGADANSTTGGFVILHAFRNDTPLSLAIVCSHRDMVELLLEHGADPNRRVQDGFTPLQLADRADIAELLLARGASMTARGYENRTPIHQAAMQGRMEVAALLLSRGADIEARDRFGRTPLLLAVDQPTATRKMVDFLLRSGARVNVSASDGETPLRAALSRDKEIVRRLLEGGADVNAPDRYGRTPLHWAVEGGDVALVELLLSHGANVNAQDTTKRTPLYYTWGGREADRKIAAMLRQRGAVER